MSRFAVEIEAITKSFRSGKTTVPALRGITIKIQPGEAYALLGPNGSGKTTTLNILSRLVEADSGSFKILGRVPEDPNYFREIAFMSGDSEYYWAFTVLDTLRFYAQLHSVSWSRVEELLVDFKGADLLSRTWLALSNGEKTRVRLVQALMTKPKVLFLDEPTVGLDPDISELVRERLRALNRAGLTLFLTSHYMKDIDSIASTIAFIRNGEILESGPRSQYGDVSDLESRFIQMAREGR